MQISQDGTILISVQNEDLEEGTVQIPASVTTIGDGAFEDCCELSKLVIHGGVTTIGTYAFRNCLGLTELVILGGVVTIGDHAFRGCCGLIKLVLSYGLKIIGMSAFDDCSRLKKLVIPASVTTIEAGAFCDCSGLTVLVILAGKITIGDHAFQGCSGLIELTPPRNLKEIGHNAFHGSVDKVRVLRLPEGFNLALRSGLPTFPSLRYVLIETENRIEFDRIAGLFFALSPEPRSASVIPYEIAAGMISIRNKALWRILCLPRTNQQYRLLLKADLPFLLPEIHGLINQKLTESNPYYGKVLRQIDALAIPTDDASLADYKTQVDQFVNDAIHLLKSFDSKQRFFQPAEFGFQDDTDISRLESIRGAELDIQR